MRGRTQPPSSVPLSDIAVDDDLVAAAGRALASGWWSTGPQVAEFESAFAQFVGVDHAVAVSSGTAALHLAAAAGGCGPGDEVVMPSLNFVAAANVVVHLGARPVLCDVGEDDPSLDPEDVDAAVGPRTRAIVALHYGGVPCDMDAIHEIAARRGLVVIEDAAHAPGARYRGRACGSLGDVGCFSFFANKNLPIGEGGMLVTDDGALADRARRLRSHGMTALSWDPEHGHAAGYDVPAIGFNYRLDEVRAAIGLVQLARLPAANAARALLAARYRERLDGVAGLALPLDAAPGCTSAHHLVVAVLPPEVERAEVRRALAEHGIQTSVHYPPIHTFSAYGELATRPLPRTDALAPRLLTLPLFPHMREDQVDAVADALLAVLAAVPARQEAHP